MGWEGIKASKMELVEVIQGIAPLSNADVIQLSAITEEVRCARNQIIIESAKVSPYIYFLKEGCCRIFYNKEDKEVVLGFAFPGEAILSLNSYIHHKSGYETVDCLEASTLYRIHVRKLKKLYQTSLAIANWGRRLAELETIKIEERLLQTLFKTAAEKYADLLARHPALLQKVKLGYIASYLGVSQVTLSRIRAEVK